MANTPNKINKIGDFCWHGVEFEVWRTGFCRWGKIWFIFEGEIIYCLERDNLCGPSGDNLRKEYFFGKLERTYDGLQNCFIEFCNVLPKESFPEEAYFKNVGAALELEKEIIKKYTHFYKKIFRKK